MYYVEHLFFDSAIVEFKIARRHDSTLGSAHSQQVVVSKLLHSTVFQELGHHTTLHQILHFLH